MGSSTSRTCSNAINTGAYNFVDPSLNSAAIRSFVSPNVTTPSTSSMVSLDASVTKKLLELPGGSLQLAIGGQVRRETLTNNNQNARLDTYTLTTSSAFGQHTVSAGYFEIDAPVLDILDITASGRYDHYSEGFSHFSPKVGFKFTPIKELAIRGTYSQGFRAPTFAESGPRSQYAGFSTFTPPASFLAAHGGVVGNTNPYAQAYQLGSGLVGNPDLKPEKSRSFTAGAIFQPVNWLSFTVDYYNVKKSDLIVAGPLVGDARNAYYSQSTLAAAIAAVAAVGPGYSVNVVDAPDPLFPNALPRVLIINAPFVNANYAITSGIDFSATAKIPISDGIRFTSRLEVTDVLQYDLHTSGGVQKFAGTLGPYELSSGNGTPKWRGNWQNTLEVGQFLADGHGLLCRPDQVDRQRRTRGRRLHAQQPVRHRRYGEGCEVLLYQQLHQHEPERYCARERQVQPVLRRGQSVQRPGADRARRLCQRAELPDHLALCRPDRAHLQDGGEFRLLIRSPSWQGRFREEPPFLSARVGH